jgi:hypothetical protein
MSKCDKEVKVRQLVVKLNEIPWIKFDERIKEFALWSNEFHFYKNEKDIIVERDGEGYFVELFFPENIEYIDIYEIGKIVKEKMIQHFRNKISHFEDLIIEINRHLM